MLRTLGALSAILPIGIFATDASGRFWYASQRVCESMGVAHTPQAESLLSIHPEDLLRVTETWRGRGIDGRKQAPFRIIGPDRSIVAFEGHAIPLLDGKHKVQSFVGYLTAYANELLEGATGLESARLLGSLLDKSREIVTVLDSEGRWRYSSAEAWRLLGYRTEFDPVNGIVDLLHPDDREAAEKWFIDILSGAEGTADSLEARVQAPDGAWRYLETTADNLLDDPVVRGIVLHSRDITERRQSRVEVEEATKRLTTLILNFPGPALLEDERRRVVIANHAFTRLIGFRGDPTKLVGSRLDEHQFELPEEFVRHELARAAEMVSRRQPVLGEQYSLRNGRAYERDYIPIFVSGQYRGHLWLVRDVSARARAETELAALVAAQREENRRLQELDGVKAEFLSAISHELRSPLTSIVSFTQLLTEGLGRDSVTEQAEFLEIVGRNANRLLRLVGDLLLLDRLDSVKALALEMNEVDFPTVISDAVLGIAPQAEQRSVTIEVNSTEGPPLLGDAGRLGQLVDNLLSNAVKFSIPDGKVSVRAEPMPGGWLLEVTDDGIGIPGREQEMLFSRFFRATNAKDHGTPGSGLGLSVAKAIVDLHGGQISVSSLEGSGTTFTVTLPRAGTAPAERR